MCGVDELPSWQINSDYVSELFTEQFKKSFKNAESFSFENGQCCLLNFPFLCATLENFIIADRGTEDISDTATLLDAFESELRKLPFTRNRSDLFSFNQSCDFVNLELNRKSAKNSEFHLLPMLRNFMLDTVLPWFVKITGIKLDPDKVDLTSSIYKKSDYLLCHDDELEGRRIAFIWYLVPEQWDGEKDGGCLELFDCDSHGHDIKSEYVESLAPWNPCHRITPKRNCFAFFEVCPRSFHQVCEILGDRDRPSIHGWFHGPSPWASNQKVKSLQIPRLIPVDVEEEIVLKWINPIYLDMNQQTKIRKRFCRSSEIQLVNFLKTEEWQNLMESLSSLPKNYWSHAGPYNHRNYDLLTPDAYQTNSLKELKSLFSSEAFLVILSDLTGIRFHPAAQMGEEKIQTDEPGVSACKRPCPDPNDEQSVIGSMTDPHIRRLTRGSYTLLGDADMQQNVWRLEAVLHLSGFGKPSIGKKSSKSEHWDSAWGGQLVFVAQGEKEDLLTVNPVDNALTLVYTGPGTASFIKYINHEAKPLGSNETVSVYDLSSIYYESNCEHESVSDENGDVESDSSESSPDDDDDDDDDDQQEDADGEDEQDSTNPESV